MLAPANHPVTVAIHEALDRLGELADVPVFGVAEAELVDDLTLLHRLAARVAELELRLAGQAVSIDVDAKTAWVRSTHQRPAVATARLRLAVAVADDDRLRVAMAATAVTEDQATEIVRALGRLPKDVDDEIRERAERHLIDLAADHDPDELRRLGRKLLEVVAPDLAEAHEARLVDDEYRRAVERCRFTMVDRGDGTCQGRFVLPSAHGHLLKKQLLALAAPKHQRAAHGSAERLPSRQRMGRAFCELLERYPTDRIPYAGGVSARVMVGLSYPQLLDDVTAAGVATIDDQVPLPAWVARRMACEAGILPAVLGGGSEVLDLGRTRRFHNEPQRIVVARRDQTCRSDGCDWPAAMCHIHHRIPWSRGGRTDVATAMALCPHHHARAHDPTYEMRSS